MGLLGIAGLATLAYYTGILKVLLNGSELGLLDSIDAAFGVMVHYMFKVLFYDIYGFPLIVIVLIIGSVTFSFYFKFINIRGFKHSIDVIRGKYDNPEDEGQISHFQALTSALSATIGLGNIAGVAIAVAQGGAGAVFWMMAIAVFSMSAKFVSASLAQVYRQIDSNGSVSGGPMYYLDIGLAAKGEWFGRFGKFLGALYALFIIGGAFGGGNMFQANQSYELVATQVPFLGGNKVFDAGEDFFDVGNVTWDGDEIFIDTNNNQIWDDNEVFTDMNGNGILGCSRRIFR